METRERALCSTPLDGCAHLGEHIPRHVVARHVDVRIARGVRPLQRLPGRGSLGDADPRVAPLLQHRRQQVPHGVEVGTVVAGVERLDHDASAELRRIFRVADQHARGIGDVRLRNLHGPGQRSRVRRRVAVHEELLLHVARGERSIRLAGVRHARGRRLRRARRELTHHQLADVNLRIVLPRVLHVARHPPRSPTRSPTTRSPAPSTRSTPRTTRRGFHPRLRHELEQYDDERCRQPTGRRLDSCSPVSRTSMSDDLRSSGDRGSSWR